MKNILITVDGSAHSYAALDVAASLAKQHDASVVLLHVVSEKSVTRAMRKGVEVEFSHEIEQRMKAVDFRAPLPDEAQYARTMLAQSNNIHQVVDTLVGESIVERATAALREYNIKPTNTIVANGDPADHIIDVSKSHNIDTIVMGSRGVGKLQGLLLGSVSQSVLHDAECSVIIVK